MDSNMASDIEAYGDVYISVIRGLINGVLTKFISKINNHPSIGKIIEALPQRIKKEFYCALEEAGEGGKK